MKPSADTQIPGRRENKKPKPRRVSQESAHKVRGHIQKVAISRELESKARASVELTGGH